MDRWLNVMAEGVACTRAPLPHTASPRTASKPLSGRGATNLGPPSRTLHKAIRTGLSLGLSKGLVCILKELERFRKGLEGNIRNAE
eukprot:4635086-Amphidinium_carterae.1